MTYIVVICDLTHEIFYMEIDLPANVLFSESAEVIIKKVEEAGIEFGGPDVRPQLLGIKDETLFGLRRITVDDGDYTHLLMVHCTV